MTKPIKRHESIQPLSRDHHHGLLLSWKIRSGISKGVDINRIKKYADWFYTNHIKPHFGIEEKYALTTRISSKIPLRKPNIQVPL